MIKRYEVIIGAMDISFLVRGLIIGFSIAAPVGPIGVLCIRRTLAEGQKAGFVSGLGAATADGIYGCVAGFGLTFISSLLIAQQTWLRLFGGLFLLYLGVKTLLSKPEDEAAQAAGGGLLANYASTFLLTITNPMTILSFAAIFAGLGLAGTGSYDTAGILVLGVFLGSGLWWLSLSGVVGLFRSKFNQRSMLWVNRLSGSIIMAFGVVAFGSMLV